MKFLFILFAILSSGRCFATVDLAFVFKGSLCVGAELCLNGDFKKAQTITILGKDSEQTCTAQVGETFVADDEVLRFPATTLVNLKNCTSVSDPILAAFEPKVKYVVPKAMTLPTADLKIVDKKIKASSAFNDLYDTATVFNYEKRAEGGIYPTIKAEELKKSEPSGVRYQIKPGKVLDLVWHRMGISGSADGAMFAVYEDKVSVVANLFKLKPPYVFLVNDRLYVLTGKSCQQTCGEITHEIYESTASGFNKVFSNSDFSK